MPDFSPRANPEEKIRSDLRVYLQYRGWLVEIMVGNAFQMGIPDLYISHPTYGHRWIDVKNPGRYKFTSAQLRKWPEWELKQEGVWIIVAATDEEYAKLFQPPNWREYLRPFELKIVNFNLEEELKSLDSPPPA